MKTLAVPVISVDAYVRSPGSLQAMQDCGAVADAFKCFGAVIAFDSRFPMGLNEIYLDMLLRYARQSDRLKRDDERALGGHQVGWTPAYTEKAYPRTEWLEKTKFKPGEEPHPVTGADPKERFFRPYRLRPARPDTKFPFQAQGEVVPRRFEEHWSVVCERFSGAMMGTIMTIAEMLAIGLGATSKDVFASYLLEGQHLLAPTMTDMSKYGTPGTVLAFLHDDLNKFTGHGQSNLSGLYIYLPDGTRILVRVPLGGILIQAGQQVVAPSGGVIQAGKHEVVALEENRSKIQESADREEVFWRVTSTFFATAAADMVLEPQDVFRTEQAIREYPPILVGDQVAREIHLIGI